MKKLLIFSLVLGVMLAAGGIVAASGMEKAGDENSRYLVKSNNGILKMIYGVNHKFNSGFTTDLTRGQLKFLDRLGVKTEKVEVYTISARPYCGDGKCHPVLENAISCPVDCSVLEPICGDGMCEGDETPENCPEDCSLPELCSPSDDKPWGIEKVNGGSGGDGIIVAVLDTGVDTDHHDLAANIKYCKTFVNRTTTCEDDNGHGTHVAGTIAASGNIIGVAPDAILMAIKVLDRKGRGYTDDIAAGIYYAANNGANIISMSLGGSSESSLIKDAIGYAIGKDVLVIASAGNSGPSEDSIGYPAANINVMAVAAFDVLDNMADWSSIGLNNNDWIIEEREIEFAAPGVAIESTFNNGCYAFMQGTSMAAPHITGIAARDWQGNAPETRIYLQDLAEIYTKDLTNGYDYGQTGDDMEAGFGLPIE